MSKFVVGDRIGYATDKFSFGEYAEAPVFGIITDVLSNGSVMVTWDHKYANNNPKPIEPTRLVLEKNLQEKYSTLEAEFKRVEIDVRAKLTEASNAILSARDLAKAGGFNLLG